VRGETDKKNYSSTPVPAVCGTNGAVLAQADERRCPQMKIIKNLLMQTQGNEAEVSNKILDKERIYT
jgi:hypothetical protein